MAKPIKRRRKKKARDMRKHAYHVDGQEKGTTSTHLMKSDIINDATGKPRDKGPYKVYPSITTNKYGHNKQSMEQASNRGEVFEFSNLKKAQKFEHGSWKKGKLYTGFNHGGVIQHD